MNIRVADKTLGECNITINDKIGKPEEYLIKALCVLQIMCMNAKEDPEKFKELLKIIDNTTKKVAELFPEDKEEDKEEDKKEEQLNGTEDFEL